MTLENWVKIEPGTSTRLHLVDHRMVERTITDPLWGVEKTVRTLMFRVDKQDGKPVEKSLSVLSDRLLQDLSPYLEGRAYAAYDWVVSKGPGKFDPPRATRMPMR